MTALVACRECGSAISPGAPFGHCPKCLIALGFVAEATSSVSPRSSSERQIGDYELLDQIGRGGMGAVYRARQISLKREVALKMILPGETTRPEAVQRFQIEAEASAKLQHPNIVPIYEIGHEAGQYFFSMRLINGANLHQCLAKYQLSKDSSISSKATARQAQERIARLISKIAAAVHFAHEQGIFHRDLKPQNILINHDGEPFLTDFGLAKILDRENSVTEPNAVLGTLNYMAPEQASGGRISRAADIFSLGAILYELLTGQSPFRGATPAETLRSLAEREPTDPRLSNRRIDPDLAVISLKCLQKNPRERYATAAGLAEDLERWMRNEPIHARPPSRTVRLNRWVRRNRPLTALIISLFAFMLLVAWQVFENWQSEQVQRGFVRALIDKRQNMLRGLTTSISLSSAELAAASGKRIRHTANAQRLVIGIYHEADQVEEIEQLAPFLHPVEKAMSRHLVRPVRIDLILYLRRENLEKAFAAGHIDIIRIGEGPLVHLRRSNQAITPLVQQVSGGKTSAVIVAMSSPITNLAGLKGKRFAAGNPTSTSSGYKLIDTFLRAGLRAADLEITYQGKSDDNWRLVREGRFDAAVVRKDNVRGSVTNYFRVLAEFPTTTMPWAAKPQLDPMIATAFTSALVGMNDRRILERLPDDATQGFKPADTNYFDWLDADMRRVEREFGSAVSAIKP